MSTSRLLFWKFSTYYFCSDCIGQTIGVFKTAPLDHSLWKQENQSIFNNDGVRRLLLSMCSVSVSVTPSKRLFVSTRTHFLGHLHHSLPVLLPYICFSIYDNHVALSGNPCVTQALLSVTWGPFDRTMYPPNPASILQLFHARLNNRNCSPPAPHPSRQLDEHGIQQLC
eukprot:TRINITY_DN76_c0_g1_i12.p1 TRINITY_DN76_c0_g1~~TRINITY_DN76_c0_g1_i12.p1  ORF type:complete len:169 (+),score=15.08 TRINITY_DN76_c0_g1_i12:2046-2552(+)